MKPAMFVLLAILGLAFTGCVTRPATASSINYNYLIGWAAPNLLIQWGAPAREVSDGRG